MARIVVAPWVREGVAADDLGRVDDIRATVSAEEVEQVVGGEVCEQKVPPN